MKSSYANLTTALSSAALVAALFGCGADAGEPASQGNAVSASASIMLDANDVSILVPLPAKVTDPGLVELAKSPDLLSLDQFTRFLAASAWTPTLEPLASDASKREIYESLRVVSIRVDPCFPGFNPGETACRPQLRLVVQSVVAQDSREQALQIKTGDATLHLFFELTPDALANVVATLKAAKAEAPELTDGKPLQVHPRLVKEGMDGTFAGELRSLIAANCQSKNLSRIAFMMVQFAPLSSFPNQWAFGAADFANGSFTPAKLAHLKQEASPQLFIMRHKKSPGSDTGPAKVDLDSLAGVLLPGGSAPDGVDFFLQSDNFLGKASSPSVKTALSSLLRVENPRLNNPNTVDCASCHVVTPLRLFAQKNGLSTSGSEFAAARYTPKAGGADASPRPFQATDDPEREMYTTVNFGYFDLKASISQRTVNESAEVANAINGMK